MPRFLWEDGAFGNPLIVKKIFQLILFPRGFVQSVNNLVLDVWRKPPTLNRATDHLMALAIGSQTIALPAYV